MTGWLAQKIDQTQTLFVSLLRIWTIPIVLLLSLASGFTTYYGMSHFITPWIALIITVAIQSIIVICSLELASIRWKANRGRFLSVAASLAISLAASVSFSYFKFYEVANQEAIHIGRLESVREKIQAYLEKVQDAKAALIQHQQSLLAEAEDNAQAAYFGTHPEISPRYRGKVGKGPFWRHYNEIVQQQQAKLDELRQKLAPLDNKINSLQTALNRLDGATVAQKQYQAVLEALQQVHLHINRVSTEFGGEPLPEPSISTHAQLTEKIRPSFAMWHNFSLFAFLCAAMVDLFTVLLSYRLELSAPAPLSKDEQELSLKLLSHFHDYRINENDELELVIEKSELERARRYSDWPRLFAVGLLLKRGLLRKVDKRTVEFSPGLYSLMAEQMSDHLKAAQKPHAADTKSEPPKTTKQSHG